MSNHLSLSLSLSPSLPFSPCPCFYHSFQFIFESIALFLYELKKIKIITSSDGRSVEGNEGALN
jgi:hypothetical protein